MCEPARAPGFSRHARTSLGGFHALDLALAAPLVAQVGAEDAVADQLPDVRDTLVARSLEFALRHAGRPDGGVKLLRSRARIPSWLGVGQHARQLGEIDAVGTLVRTASLA